MIATEICPAWDVRRMANPPVVCYPTGGFYTPALEEASVRVHFTDPSAVIKADQISEAALARPVQPKPARRNFRDITDQPFYSLTALAYVGLKRGIALWRCQCECGRYCLVTSNALVSGGRRSCVLCARASLRQGKAKWNAARTASRLPNLFGAATEKPCCRCKKSKPIDDFCRKRTELDGLSRMCRECARRDKDQWAQGRLPHVRDTNRTASQRYAERHPERRREARIRCKYGIGLKEYDAILERQGGACAICGAPPTAIPHTGTRALCIDHDHITDKVRGLLCNQCNYGIGHFADNPDLLAKAIAYLRAAQEKESVV